MANVTGLLRRQAKQQALLTKMYDTYEVGRTYENITQAAVAVASGISPTPSPGETSASFIEFTKLGILRHERVAVTGGSRGLTTRMDLTLLLDRKDAWQNLIAAHETEHRQAIDNGKRAAGGAGARAARKNARLAAEASAAVAISPDDPMVSKMGIRKNGSEPVEAIAGPDKPNPFEALRPLRKVDDAKALVEAARQYAGRADRMGTHVEQLIKTAAELGITVDREAIMSGVKLERDERLETVSLVLPVINDLERLAERQGGIIADLREKAGNHDQLVRENERLKKRIEQFIAQQVMSAQRSV